MVWQHAAKAHKGRRAIPGPLGRLAPKVKQAPRVHQVRQARAQSELSGTRARRPIAPSSVNETRWPFRRGAVARVETRRSFRRSALQPVVQQAPMIRSSLYALRERPNGIDRD